MHCVHSKVILAHGPVGAFYAPEFGEENEILQMKPGSCPNGITLAPECLRY
jgi:hypothetical protein